MLFITNGLINYAFGFIWLMSLTNFLSANEPSQHKHREDVAKDDTALADLPLANYDKVFKDLVGGFRMGALAGSKKAHNTQYSRGILALGADGQSMFLSGFDHGYDTCEFKDAIVRFKIPGWGRFTSPKDLHHLPEVAANSAQWIDVAQRIKHQPNPCITDYAGFYTENNRFYFSLLRSYDARRQSNYNWGVIDDLSAPHKSAINGLFRLGFPELKYSAYTASWISPLPNNLRQYFNHKTHIAGGAARYSINSRHSLGPSFYAFNLADFRQPAKDDGVIDGHSFMHFPITDKGEILAMGRQLTNEHWNRYNCTLATRPDCERATFTSWQDIAACDGRNCPLPIWTIRSDAKTAFIVPGTRTYAVIGVSGCLEKGCAYKTQRADGFTCNGPCPKDVADQYAYYWLFDLLDLAQEKPLGVDRMLPYEHGKITALHAFKQVIKNSSGHDEAYGLPLGAYWDANSQRLFLSLSEASRYKRGSPPLIVAFDVAKSMDQ